MSYQNKRGSGSGSAGNTRGGSYNQGRRGGGRGGFQGRGDGRYGGGQGKGDGGRGGGFVSRGESSGGRGGRGGSVATLTVFRPNNQLVPSPNKDVTKAEDDFQSKQSNLKMSEIRVKFPVRPSYGTKGTAVTLWANYFELSIPKTLGFWCYEIVISAIESSRRPETSVLEQDASDSKSREVFGRKREQIVRLLLDSPELAQYRAKIVTDFRSNLISSQALPENLEVTVTYRGENENEPRKGATTYHIQFILSNKKPAWNLLEYVQSTTKDQKIEDVQPVIQAFNILLKHYSKSLENLVAIGSSKSFSLSETASKGNLAAGVIALRGFFSSVRPATGRVLVNVNVSHGAFLEPISLHEFMMKLRKENFDNNAMSKFLEKVRIRTTHMPKKTNKDGKEVYRVKTIFRLAHPDDGKKLPHPPKVEVFGAGANGVKFWVEKSPGTTGAGGAWQGKKKPTGADSGTSTQGRYMSVSEFFAQTYAIRIDDGKFPVVNIGTEDKPTYLPAQVCIVMRGQSVRRKLNIAETQAMIKFAVRPPWMNAQSIVENGFETVGLSSESNGPMKNFGLSAKQELITVLGRILQKPKVCYKNSEAQVNSGSWNMQNNKSNICALLQKWTYLGLSLPHKACLDPTELNQIIVKEFVPALQNLGMKVSVPANFRVVSLKNEEDDILEDFIKGASISGQQMIFIVLPDSNTRLYNRIKFLTEVKHGIHSVCCLAEKLGRPKMRDQYLGNIALKVNLRKGGTNQIADASSLSFIREDKTMVVGIDVTHPSPDSTIGAPSVAGMVASIDQNLGQWPATLRVQSGSREDVADLESMLKSRLRLWKSKGKLNDYPENILVYRDGVSEGQYQMVVDKELPQLRKACEKMYQPAQTKKGLPYITVVIVGKRHHTRFYPTQQGEADGSSNTRPGTVVDRGVTEPRPWDFFLQPHAALQGTARPAHYYVVYDDIFRRRRPPYTYNKADMLEELTHAMCYTFGRATKAVSVCPPAYYADIACERARCYLSNVYNPRFEVKPPEGEGGESEAMTVTAEAVAALALKPGAETGKGKGKERAEEPDTRAEEGKDFPLGQVVTNRDVEVHESIRDSMFYI